MGKKHVTKIDPDEKLAHYLQHQSERKNKHIKKDPHLSASLKQLNVERRKSLFRRLGLIVSVSLAIILVLGYYISPIANISSIKIVGADDLPVVQIAKTTNIKTDDKVFDCLLNPNALKHRLVYKYTEIKGINLSVANFNQLVLHISEHPVIGYIKNTHGYQKILAGGKLGTITLPWSKVDQGRPLFINYNHKTSLERDIKLLNALPESFRNQVKLLSGNTRRASQIIFVMKDVHVVVGDTASIKSKIKYYDEIKNKAGKDTVIDLEIGAFSRPLTANEKRVYGIS